MTRDEAADILDAIADLQEASYQGVLESGDRDAIELLRSSGDIDCVVAIRTSAKLQREVARIDDSQLGPMNLAQLFTPMPDVAVGRTIEMTDPATLLPAQERRPVTWSAHVFVLMLGAALILAVLGIFGAL